MGKQNQRTKFLYRKSNCSLSTLSKTCSGASLYRSKSGILHFKKKFSKTKYYEENGIIKRDLSIETDHCILRGYYKNKIARFKCSLNTIEPGNDQPTCDRNSHGDSINKESIEKNPLNTDVASLVVDNLKNLLNSWVQKYLLNDKDTKQDVETVIDSILHKFQLRHNYSSCTCSLNITVDEKNQIITSINAINKPRKCGIYGQQSCQTAPVSEKNIKLISTLSIPRNKTKKNMSTNLQYSKYLSRKVLKNMDVSRSSTHLMSSSILNLLNISTKSFTKRCATYDGKHDKTRDKSHEFILLPKSSYSENVPDAIHSEINYDFRNDIYPNANASNEIEPVQSLVKSIYAHNPGNIISTDRNIYQTKQDNCTMTDTDSAINMNILATPIHCPKLNWKKAENITQPTSKKMIGKQKQNTKRKRSPNGHKVRKTMPKKNDLRSFRCFSKKNNIRVHLTNLYRKPDSTHTNTNSSKDLQSMLRHFSHYLSSKNIKFDIVINVFPETENKIEDENDKKKSEKYTVRNDKFTPVYNVTSTQLLPENIHETKTSDVLINKPNCEPTSRESQPNLISILDGAISQTKYVISNKGSFYTTDNTTKLNIDRNESNKTSTKLEISKDISELRKIIKDLSSITENLVKENLQNLTSNKRNDVGCIPEGNDNKMNKNYFKKSTISKCIQVSNINSDDKNLLISGFKFKKEPKNYTDRELINIGLGKKSISYNIIESESILRVTDMSSVPAETSTDVLMDTTLTRSLRKSKSQFEMTVGKNEKKLLTYYCDEFLKSKQIVQGCNNCCNCVSQNTSDLPGYVCGENEKKQDDNKFCQDCPCEGAELHPPINEDDCEAGCPGLSCTSVCLDRENRKKITLLNRSGISFWEGLMYCILLWIPVVLICWLIYLYVIKDIIQPHNPATLSSYKKSMLYTKLSDLGF